MRLFHIYLLILSAILIAPHNGYGEETTIAERLAAGGHVIMIRHAIAPGSGDPANFRIGDCATQRNLSDEGRKQSRKIGQWLREHGVKKPKIYSSQWCRCMDTAKLLGLGPVDEMSGLNSFYERSEDRGPNLAKLRKFMDSLTPDDDLIIMVTHFVTISAITGKGIGSGEGILLESKGGGKFDVVERLSFEL